MPAALDRVDSRLLKWCAPLHQRFIFVGGRWQEGMSGKCMVSKQLDMSGWIRNPVYL